MLFVNSREKGRVRGRERIEPETLWCTGRHSSQLCHTGQDWSEIFRDFTGHVTKEGRLSNFP